ncbi:hypothetical protein ACSAZK_05905 [Methanosarcina sp. Mfa9]|uniref:hypothetical protein n=1 Tax=Methanosarcina sp. Mfa9 TaxID=3439063 RepID=UPI003F83D39A
MGGVGTDIIFKQLNPDSCKIHLQWIRESGDEALVDPGRECFQNYMKLPRKRELRTVPLILAGEGIGKLKVLKGRILARGGTGA